jgi:peptide/nickel transport system permease protein
MLIYLVRRIFYAAPVALGVALLVFMLVHIAPGDPISAILPPEAPQELVVKLKAYYGFDKPLPIQFLRWLWVVLGGDLGTSVATGRPVAGEIGRALTNTLILATSASILAFTLASILGTLAAYSRRPIVDRLITAVSVTGVSVPHYWLAMVLVVDSTRDPTPRVRHRLARERTDTRAGVAPRLQECGSGLPRGYGPSAR